MKQFRVQFSREFSRAFSLGCGLVAMAAAQSASQDSQQILQAFVASQRIPGLSCAVWVDGSECFATGLGLADVENDVPATPATVYRLASISKCLTALAVVQLAERGALDLSAPVGSLLEEWPAKRWPVSCAQLLGHLGGVRHYRPLEAEVTQHFANQRAGLVRFQADPLLHEPGSKYLYSTFGFNLLGAVVEQCSGESLAEYVRAHLAAPAGASSVQDDDPARVIMHRAQGYVRVAGELRNGLLMDSSYKLGGGGFCSSAHDLACLGSAVLAGKIVKPESLATMWTSQRTGDGKATGYGYGFGVGKLDGQPIAQHSGAQSRVSTHWVLVPGTKTVVVLLCNLEGVRLGELAHRLARRFGAPASK